MNRFVTFAVEGGAEVDRVLVDLAEHLHGSGAQAALGVAVGGRGIIQAAEVAVRIDEGDVAPERLAHPGERVVDRAVAVGVVLAHRLADHACTLAVWAVGAQAHGRHRVQDPALHRLEAVTDIGDRPAGDHRQRVGEERLAQLLGYRNLHDLTGELGEQGILARHVNSSLPTPEVGGDSIRGPSWAAVDPTGDGTPPLYCRPPL